MKGSPALSAIASRRGQTVPKAPMTASAPVLFVAEPTPHREEVPGMSARPSRNVFNIDFPWQLEPRPLGAVEVHQEGWLVARRRDGSGPYVVAAERPDAANKARRGLRSWPGSAASDNGWDRRAAGRGDRPRRATSVMEIRTPRLWTTLPRGQADVQGGMPPPGGLCAP